MSSCTLLVAYFLVGAPSAAGGAEVVVVVNESNPIQELSSDEVAKIYLGKQGFWKHGKKILPVLQKPDSASLKRFLKDVIHKSVAAYTSHWNIRIFSGKGVPPRRFGRAAALLEFVKSKEGAIGLVQGPVNPQPGLRIIRISQ